MGMQVAFYKVDGGRLAVGPRDENVAAVVKALGGLLKRVPGATG